MELYRRPTNRFVAGFIGSPPMNLLEGRLVSADGTVAFELSAADGETDGFRLLLPAAQANVLAGCAGKPLTLGLRPEAVRVTFGSDAPLSTAQAQVELGEPLGAETLLHTRLAGQALVVRVHGVVTVRPGDPLEVGLAPNDACFFDPDSGRALNAEPA